MKMKKLFRYAIHMVMLTVIFMAASKETFASSGNVPAKIYGYVGDCLDIEAKYGIEIDYIDDEDIYYEGDFIHAGKTNIYYYDENDDYQSSTIYVKYNPSLRLIADEWWYSGKYYSIRVYNISNSSVTFTNEKANYVYKGHSKQNCKFKLSKSVTIKSGKCKVLKYKRVSGGNYYMPSKNSAYMQMKCKFKKKKYTIKNIHGDVNFYKKSGSKWKFIDYKGDYDYF